MTFFTNRLRQFGITPPGMTPSGYTAFRILRDLSTNHSFVHLHIAT